MSLSNGNIKSVGSSREDVTSNQSFRADIQDSRQSDLHRLASLRLQQTLLQSHDKQSTNYQQQVFIHIFLTGFHLNQSEHLSTVHMQTKLRYNHYKVQYTCL